MSNLRSEHQRRNDMPDLSKGRPIGEVVALDWLLNKKQEVRDQIAKLGTDLRRIEMMIKHYQSLTEE